MANTRTEQTPSGIHVTFEGAAFEVINQIGALMASAADTFSATVVLSGIESRTREEVESEMMQHMLDNAWKRLHKKRAERGCMS